MRCSDNYNAEMLFGLFLILVLIVWFKTEWTRVYIMSTLDSPALKSFKNTQEVSLNQKINLLGLNFRNYNFDNLIKKPVVNYRNSNLSSSSLWVCSFLFALNLSFFGQKDCGFACSSSFLFVRKRFRNLISSTRVWTKRFWYLIKIRMNILPTLLAQKVLSYILIKAVFLSVYLLIFTFQCRMRTFWTPLVDWKQKNHF